MNLWQRIVAFFTDLFSKKPTEAATPTQSAAPAAPSAPAAASAPPAAVAPADPPSYAIIRGLISKWRSWNLDWKTIAFNLQTAAGLGRGLSGDEWDVAYAAGFPRELNAAPAPDTSARFVAKPVMTYAEAMGQAIDVVLGKDDVAVYKLTECPARVRVTVLQKPGSKAGAFVLAVNGQSQAVDNVDASQPITVDGPDVNVSITSRYEGTNYLNLNINPGV